MRVSVVRSDDVYERRSCNCRCSSSRLVSGWRRLYRLTTQGVSHPSASFERTIRLLPRAATVPTGEGPLGGPFGKCRSLGYPPAEAGRRKDDDGMRIE